MVMLKLPNCWFPQKPIWLQETGAAAASAARGFHWIKVTRSLASVATLPLKLPSNGPWKKIIATLLPISAASGRRNDCTRQAYATRAIIKYMWLNKRVDWNTVWLQLQALEFLGWCANAVANCNKNNEFSQNFFMVEKRRVLVKMWLVTRFFWYEPSRNNSLGAF